MSAKTTSSPRSLRLKIASDPANLADARKAVESFAESLGFDATGSAEIGLSLNEALANVMRHAYGGATDRPIEIDANATDDGIRITLRDWGNGVNPAAQPIKEHDPLTPGGLGLTCLRKLMDAMVYAPQPDGMLLTMTKAKRSSSSHRTED